MNIETLKENLSRLGVNWCLIGSKICVPCPFSGHGALEKNRQANFLLGVHTDLGECEFCGTKANSEKLLEEFKAQHSLLKNGASSSTKKAKELKIWSLAEVYDADFGEQDWIIEGLIPADAISMISGDPQNGKTWITMLMAASVALGKPFLDHFTCVQGRVLFIDEEDHLRHVKQRFAKLGVPPEAPIRLISQSGFKVDDDRWLRLVLQEVKETSTKLVIMDSFIRIHSHKENDASEMAFVFERMREITKLGAAVLLTHHHRKEGAYGPKNPSQSIRGSSDILAALDCHLSVEKCDAEIRVWQNKLRVDEAVKPFVIKAEIGSERASFEYGGEMPEKLVKKEKVKELILEILKEGEHDRGQLEEKIKVGLIVGKSVIGEALQELELEQKVSVRKGEKGRKFYTLVEPPAI